MLYRRTPELPPLKNSVNGENLYPEEISAQTNISAGELFAKSLWLETSLTKNKDRTRPATGSGNDGARTIFSRKANADLLLKNDFNEICATYAEFTKLTATSITSEEYISSTNVTAEIINTNNITANSGNITVLYSDEISTDNLSVSNGEIDNISGYSIHYENAGISDLRSIDISCKDISATGVAYLTAAATYWADLAELYKSDNVFEPGTLVKFNGENEIEIASDGIVNGVVSKNPALLMNSSLKNKSCANPVILVGRSQVKIKDKIDKFDRIELSDIPGVAQKSSDSNKKILGISLESKSKLEIEPVECVIKLAI